MSIKKVFFVFLLMNVIFGRLKGIVLSVSSKSAAVPVQLEVVILQYIGWGFIGWGLLVIQDFFFNQLSYFCQFLMDNFG
jgi:hypothetical protein